MKPRKGVATQLRGVLNYARTPMWQKHTVDKYPNNCCDWHLDKASYSCVGLQSECSWISEQFAVWCDQWRNPRSSEALSSRLLEPRTGTNATHTAPMSRCV